MFPTRSRSYRGGFVCVPPAAPEGTTGSRTSSSISARKTFPGCASGVGSPPHPDYDMADWVMGVPRGEDAAALEKAEERAADAIECCVQHGIDRAMNRYNG